MNLINEFMNPNSVLRQGQVLSHALGMKATGTEFQKLVDPMILQRMCKASYALNKGQTPEADIEGWTLKYSTPTVLCYSKYGFYVVAVRGTATTEDWQTNATIALNQLADTKRAQTMIQTVEEWKQKHQSETQWYATGHSLGGALCDVLLREKLVREAFTFNPAVQPQDFNGKLPNRRVYARGDPLYQLMGQFTVGAVLLPAKDFLTELRYRVLGETPMDYLSQHALSAFKDAPQSALVGNAKKQPKKPKTKPRLPIPRGPNMQLVQDLFARLQAQRQDREMDDLTREMDQIIPKDKTPAPPPPSPPSGDGRPLCGGVKQEDLVDALLYVLRYSEAKLYPETVEKGLNIVVSSFARLLKSATFAEKRRIEDYLDEIIVERNYFKGKEGNILKQARIAGITIPLLQRIAKYLQGLRSEEWYNRTGTIRRDDVAQSLTEERRDVGRIVADKEAKIGLTIRKGKEEIEKEAERELEQGSPIKSPKKEFSPKGKARPATFQYSRDDLTTKQKAAERAAYYRKHPAEKPKRTKEVEVEPVEPVKPVKFDEPTLAERAKLTRAKITLRRVVVKRLLKKSAEIRLWIALYKKGSYLNSTELKTKEREAFDTGVRFIGKSEEKEASKQTYDISIGKWKDYISDNVYDRISKQVAAIKARVQKENDELIENGPTADRKKKAPKKEGVEIWKTPNGYEWYVEDGKVFDLDGSRVGYTGMAAFKNITKK